MHKVIWSAKSKEQLKSFDKVFAEGLFKKITEYLALNPNDLGKPLSNKYKNLFRYRYKDKYRIVYKICDREQEIHILFIGNRDEIYK